MQTTDWKNLPFAYHKTNFNIRSTFKDGQWSTPDATSSETISLHMAATCLHYGQEAFEGLKAFKGKDGKIRVFRWEDNAQRMHETAQRIMMQPVPHELFFECIKQAILLNTEHIPPYGTGASLYIRPLLIGSGPQVGVKPAEEYMFVVFVSPVGPYFKEGFNPVTVQIVRDYDRAAPKGTGSSKVGGNYAAGLLPGTRAHDEGYTTMMFLDSSEQKYIDECGPANFFGIKNNTYITPDSRSILPSITNKSLITRAELAGLKVERRRVAIDELDTFDEVGACGTAAVISPIKYIFDRETGKEYNYCADGNAGPISTMLYQKLQAIQLGDEPDPLNWITFID